MVHAQQVCPSGGERGCSNCTAAVERIWHVQDSQGQILTLSFRSKHLKSFELFPPCSEASEASKCMVRAKQVFPLPSPELTNYIGKSRLELGRIINQIGVASISTRRLTNHLGISSERQNQNLALTVLYVPYWLDSGDAHENRERGIQRHGLRAAGLSSSFRVCV